MRGGDGATRGIYKGYARGMRGACEGHARGMLARSRGILRLCEGHARDMRGGMRGGMSSGHESMQVTPEGMMQGHVMQA